MPSLISATERAVLTGIFDDIFDTFKRDIVIFKEPLQTTVTPQPTDGLFGFGPDQTNSLYDYTEVSGIYPAVIRYTPFQTTDIHPEIVAGISAGEVSIKVRRDARDFINTGKTTKIIVDGRTFLLDTDERKQSFLDSAYYVFYLKATK